MSRAFYQVSRAHHAYCMAIDFGMKFTKRDGFWTPEGLLHLTGAGGYKIEVAEESMCLLLPEEGDIVRFGDNRGHAEPYVIVDTDYSGFESDENVAMLENFEPSWWNWDILLNKSIIQRGGHAFHWPEFEP